MSSDQNDATQFQLLQTSCPVKDWVSVDDTANGAGPDSSFSFQSFRFPGKNFNWSSKTAILGQNSFWLHCRVYMCHSIEDCLQSCTSRRRRSVVENMMSGRSDEVTYQDNGLPETDTLSNEIYVTDVEVERLDKARVLRVAGRISDNMAEMQNNFKNARKAVANLKRMIEQVWKTLTFHHCDVLS